MDSTPHIPDHQLLRRIGKGAYGEVWLARNVTGAYRAVKIVSRSSFDHERPYEREFSGMQKFEPVSRTHETQVAILHVGRNDADGYFYYIMEVADDRLTGQDINPEDYEPWTLRSYLFKNGRVPIDECLDIGIHLASALDHIHKNGLVHRDVKPSNIIFIKQVPKLADIGLVSATNAERSFVGTEGYIPPEGPGSPQADIYSLGKVLYEISTGRNRLDFPELPTLLKDLPERGALVQFNEVVLRACEDDPKNRYQSAEEMLADLWKLKGGKSIKRLESRWGMAKSLAAILITGVMLSGLYLGRKILPSGRPVPASASATSPPALKNETSVAPSFWLPLDIAPACNADIITTAARKSADALTFNGGTLASSSWLQKNGYSEEGIPDDGRIAIPEANDESFFQLQLPPNKNAILISGPEGSHPEPVAIQLAATDHHRISNISVLHLTSWCGSGLLNVTLHYEAGADTKALLRIFDNWPGARPVQLPSDVKVANTTVDIRTIDRSTGLEQTADLLAEQIPVDSKRILRSITFSFASLIMPPKKVSEQISRNRTVTAILAISALTPESGSAGKLELRNDEQSGRPAPNALETGGKEENLNQPSTQTANPAVIYQTDFGPPTFQPGNLPGQDGWVMEGSRSEDAARVISSGNRQRLAIFGSDIKKNGNRYIAFFRRPLSYPAQSQTSGLSISADLQLDVGPQSGNSKYFFAFFNPTDEKGTAVVAIGLVAKGGIFVQNWATPNIVIRVNGTATAPHNFRMNLNFAERQAVLFLDGKQFGFIPFNPKANSEPRYLTFSMESSDPMDSTLFVNHLSAEEIEALAVATHLALTPDLLQGRRFHFIWKSREDSGANGIALLNRNGTISGIKSPNETFWLIDGEGRLIFKHRDGRISTIFTNTANRDGKWFFSGPFQFKPNVQHELEEIVQVRD